MPQLDGPEESIIASLLEKHIVSIESLDRAMHHSGHGHVNAYAANLNFPETVAKIVSAFSNKFQIGELVQDLLDDPEGLNGSCPPITAWLQQMQPLLANRKESYAIKCRVTKYLRYPIAAFVAVVAFYQYNSYMLCKNVRLLTVPAVADDTIIPRGTVLTVNVAGVGDKATLTWDSSSLAPDSVSKGGRAAIFQTHSTGRYKISLRVVEGFSACQKTISYDVVDPF